MQVIIESERKCKRIWLRMEKKEKVIAQSKSYLGKGKYKLGTERREKERDRGEEKLLIKLQPLIMWLLLETDCLHSFLITLAVTASILAGTIHS